MYEHHVKTTTPKQKWRTSWLLRTQSGSIRYRCSASSEEPLASILKLCAESVVLNPSSSTFFRDFLSLDDVESIHFFVAKNERARNSYWKVSQLSQILVAAVMNCQMFACDCVAFLYRKFFTHPGTPDDAYHMINRKQKIVCLIAENAEWRTVKRRVQPANSGNRGKTTM